MEFIEKKRNRFVALVFAILTPGFGQLYNGELKRATYIFGAFFVATLLFRSMLTIWLGYLFADLMLIAAMAAWGVGIILAVRSAGRPRLVPAKGRWAIYFGALVLAGALLAVSRATMAAETYRVPAESMSPTLLSGDTIMVNRWAYHGHTPERGDVIVFLYPKNESINYVKRVIGVPGDQIEIHEGKLSINGAEVIQAPDPEFSVAGLTSPEQGELKAYKESNYRVLRSVSALNTDFGPVAVPPGKYFVLGDNRDRSSDSRIWGFVPFELVKGKAVYVQYSRQSESGHFRRERFGLKID